jgi:hypothetical protein
MQGFARYVSGRELWNGSTVGMKDTEDLHKKNHNDISNQEIKSR